tara:strand:- start:266 stop:694 length:429 start_codon:yes stop_codon:yes gene_type:complete
MSVKVKIKNIGKEKLKKYERTLESKLKQIMSASGDLVRNEAIQSIMSGAKGGRTYEKYNPRRTHVASSDGQPPASDTGFLVSNIVKNVKRSGHEIEVESKANYSKFLEFGTQNMKPRPFLFPALEKNKPKIRRLLKNVKGKV